LKAIGFFIAASVYCKNTGGLVYHAQYIANLILFYVYDGIKMFKNWQKGTKCNMASSIFFDKAGNQLQPGAALLDLALNSVAMLIGYFLGSLLVGAVVGYSDIQRYQVIAQAPGAFPGFDANTGAAYGTIDDPRAFITEMISAAVLGLYFTFVGLNITRRSIKKEKNSSPDSEKQDRWHMKAVRGGALLVFGVSVITNNITGGSLDFAHWVSSNLAVAILSGKDIFVGGAYSSSGEYWYVYVFGALTGWIAGALIAYISFGFVYRKKLDNEIVSSESSLLSTEGTGRRSRQNRDRVNDILGNSDLFAQN
jgi:glycerol uptake facilitator-like aquaporin